MYKTVLFMRVGNHNIFFLIYVIENLAFKVTYFIAGLYKSLTIIKTSSPNEI